MSEGRGRLDGVSHVQARVTPTTALYDLRQDQLTQSEVDHPVLQFLGAISDEHGLTERLNSLRLYIEMLPESLRDSCLAQD